MSEASSLQQYIRALQHENRSRSMQQDVLHRQLQIINSQLRQMEQYYFQNRDLVRQVELLRQEIYQKDAQIDRMNIQITSLEEKLSSDTFSQAKLKQNEKAIQDVRRQFSQTLLKMDHLQEILDMERSLLNEQKVDTLIFQETSEKLKVELQKREIQLGELKLKLSKVETASSQCLSQENNDYSSLLKKYETVQEQAEQREQKLKQLQVYVDELEYCCQSLNNNLQSKDIELKQLKTELSYLQKQRYSLHFNPIKRQPRQRQKYSRSQVTTPRWKQSPVIAQNATERSSFDENSFPSLVKAPSQDLQRSECESISSVNSQAKRLQKRNSVLRQQNEMLLRNMGL